MKTVVILDNGHGVNTPGKCSPDKRIKEYSYTREIVKRISETLTKDNIENIILVPEEIDIPLSTRVSRANSINSKEKLKGNNTILISVHLNAAGNGQWNTARGFSVYVSKNASSKSNTLASLFTSTSLAKNLKGNRATPKEGYYSQNFYIIKNTVMPAVLTENLFQDNKEDVEWLLTEKGKQTIVDLHVEVIKQYLNTYK